MQDVFLPEGRWTVEGEHRRGERNRRQTGSMYTPAYRVLVSSEFTEGSFIPRQTGIVCASGQTTWTPECQVLVSSKFREGSFIPRQTGIACAGEQQTRVTSAYLATLQTRPNGAFVVYWYSFSNSCTVVRSLGLCLV